MFDVKYFDAHSRSGLLRFSAVAEIAAALRAGGFAILPTETGYMLAVLATSEGALGRAFEAKRRKRTEPMHVACASPQMAGEYADLLPEASRIMSAFTPGPVTVVARQTGKLPDSLVTLNGTVGIRIPDHAATLQVVEAVGVPITATSLNESGHPPISVDRVGLAMLEWPDGCTVHVVRDDSAVFYDRASTLVRVLGGNLEMLREGPVTKAEIEAVAYVD